MRYTNLRLRTTYLLTSFMCMLFVVGKFTFTAYEDSEMPYLL